MLPTSAHTELLPDSLLASRGELGLSAEPQPQPSNESPTTLPAEEVVFDITTRIEHALDEVALAYQTPELRQIDRALEGQASPVDKVKKVNLIGTSIEQARRNIGMVA